MVFSERACSGAKRNNESLTNSVFERRTSTGSGLFASLGSGLVQTLGQIVFIREKKLSNANLLESRHIKEKKASLTVDVRRSKTSLLKLPAHNSTHSSSKIFIIPFFQSEKFIILFEKLYIVLIADKGNRYSITPQKRVLSHYSKTKIQLFSFQYFCSKP